MPESCSRILVALVLLASGCSKGGDQEAVVETPSGGDRAFRSEVYQAAEVPVAPQDVDRRHSPEPPAAGSDETSAIDELSAAREEWVEQFRVTGALDQERAAALEAKAAEMVKTADGRPMVQALFELATIQRIRGRFVRAIASYERGATLAEKLPDAGLAFDMWLGIARAHVYGTNKHGAAAGAFERAVALAGESPTAKQRYEMADYASQLQDARGELEAALVSGLDAARLAQDDTERFYALHSLGSVLRGFAQSCDHRWIEDSKSPREHDLWGACKRVVSAAQAHYRRAVEVAKSKGWRFLVEDFGSQMKQLDIRRSRIESRARVSADMLRPGLFDKERVGGVLVSEDFMAGGSALSKDAALRALLDRETSSQGDNNPGVEYLRGVKANLDKQPDKALEHFERAARLLELQRSGFFDLRHRGTVMERYPAVIRDLGLELLALDRKQGAFKAFDSLRSRGLSRLEAAFARSELTASERSSLAELVQLESLASAKQRALARTTIAGIEHPKAPELLEALYEINRKQRDQRAQAQLRALREKLASIGETLPTLSQLKEAVHKAGVPVVLYWVTPTNVLVWVVSPAGEDVKTVFLPKEVVIDKARRLLRSCTSPSLDFDEAVAKQLFAYLVKPFARLLDHEQILIVPQGPLVGLPFEVLVDAETARFLVESHAVSYAPSVSFAIRALGGEQATTVSAVTAVYDETLAARTMEIARIDGLAQIEVDSHPTKAMDAEETLERLGRGRNLHVLLHGKYSRDDPLQSSLLLVEAAPRPESLTAADLLAVDWRERPLTVFSACEGARVQTRISNESFGISWALVAGGARSVVLSRWLVNGESNADWMETFYGSLAKGGMSVAAAASRAMRKAIGSERRHPFYWAGPQVIGR